MLNICIRMCVSTSGSKSGIVENNNKKEMRYGIVPSDLVRCSVTVLENIIHFIKS